MKKIVIKGYVSAKLAVAAGRSEYGDAAIELDDADVASLSEGARRIINEVVERDARVWLLGAEWDSTALIEALEEQAKAEAEAEAKAKAAKEARIELALATPLEGWVGSGLRGRPEIIPPGLLLGDHDDCRVLARRAEAVAAMAPALAAWEAEAEKAEAKAKAAKAEAEAAAKAAKERATLGARAYAIAHVPELAEAAEHGYRVAGAVAEAYARAIVEALAVEKPGMRASSAVLKAGTAQHRNTKWAERAAPSAYAVRAQRQLVAVVEKSPRPDGWDVEVLRVQRLTLPDEEGTPLHYTALVVVIHSPVSDERVLIIDIDAL